MAASWLPIPSSDGHLRTSTKFFADVVSRRELGSAASDIGSLGSHRGELALVISRQDLLILTEPYKNVLVGRFAFRRPPMEVIRKFFVSLGLKSSCFVGLLDSNHVLMRPTLEEDDTRLFVCHTGFVQNLPMVISKWMIDFKTNQECSTAPVWVNLPGLPLPFFDKKTLAEIGFFIGQPLQVDSATSNLKRPSVARLLVEIDMAKALVKHIWISDEDYGQ